MPVHLQLGRIERQASRFEVRWCFRAAWAAPTGVESHGTQTPDTHLWSRKTRVRSVGWRRRLKARPFLTTEPRWKALVPAGETLRSASVALPGRAKSHPGGG